jgi:hypothetical protein
MDLLQFGRHPGMVADSTWLFADTTNQTRPLRQHQWIFSRNVLWKTNQERPAEGEEETLRLETSTRLETWAESAQLAPETVSRDFHRAFRVTPKTGAPPSYWRHHGVAAGLAGQVH